MADQVSHAGQRLGNYRLVRLLGKGGFAEVYLSEHLHLNTQAAVKLLHAQLADADVDTFRYEAQTIARLLHPHIVRVLDFGVEAGAPYLIMDYAPNGTLRQLHPRGSRLPLPTIVTYTQQIAAALQYAHDNRLIHRDVKPENMLVDRNNNVLLSDFGIALAAQSSRYHSPQNIAGTAAYMAPEQIQAHPRPASDQYALAIVVYEWLCGNRPFQGSYTEIAIKHTLTPPPPLSGSVPGLPPAVEQVVMIALQKDPHQRFPNIRAFALALQQAAGQYQQPHFPPPTASTFVLPPAQAPAQFQAPGSASMRPPMSVAQPGASTYYTAPLNSSSMQQMTPQPIMPSQSTSGSFTPPLAQMPTTKPQRSISRRSVIAGAVGIAAISSVGTWYALSQRSGPTQFSPGTTPPAKLPTTGSTGFANSLTPDAAFITYSGQTDVIWAVSWSPDGKYIVSCSKDGTAHVWSASSGQRTLSYRSNIQPAQSDDWARAAAWSPDSKQVAIGFIDGTTQIVEPLSGQRITSYGGKLPPVAALGWSTDGKYFAVGSSDQQIRVYEVTSGKLITTYGEHVDFITALAWSHSSQQIVSGSSDGKVKVWDALSGHTLLNYNEHNGSIGSVAWSYDNTRIASTSDNKANVWEVPSGHTLISYDKHTGNIVNTAVWSHNDKYILSGGNDVYVHIWEPATGKLVHRTNTFVIFGAAWSPDDTHFVTAGYRNVSQIWKVQ